MIFFQIFSSNYSKMNISPILDFYIYIRTYTPGLLKLSILLNTQLLSIFKLIILRNAQLEVGQVEYFFLPRQKCHKTFIKQTLIPKNYC